MGAAAIATTRMAVLPQVPLTLGLVAVGLLLGAATALIVVRVWANDVRRTLLRLADGQSEARLDGRGMGPLRMLVQPMERVGDAFGSALEGATIDRLTRIGSRPTLLDRLFDEVDRATRYDRPLAIAFVDLDHFKAVNDTYGHAAGDVVLRGVAAVFRDNLRSTDMIGRYGGEEFMVVLPETTVEEATAVAEKLRLLVLKERFPVAPDLELGVSVSIGIAGGSGQRLRVDTLVRDADAAMYSAKSLGRNQTYVFSEPDEDARVPRAPISPEGRARATEVGEVARRAAEAALASVILPLPHYRGKPSSLIAAIAVRLARELGLPDSEIERIRVASLLHDIGKVALPADVLEKPGPLTSVEWQSVVQHPRIGQVIIDQVAALKDAGAIVLHHHERYAGHGYPFGLRGNDIPLGARIVAIADAYDAMISDRPYKRAIGHQAAIDELRRHARSQFDPQLVELFCELYAASPPIADPELLDEATRAAAAEGAASPRRRTRRRATA
jgi:diguanylate cyclase (GGDEF)-like protein